MAGQVTAVGHDRSCLPDSLTTSTVNSDESGRQGCSSTPDAATPAPPLLRDPTSTTPLSSPPQSGRLQLTVLQLARSLSRSASVRAEVEAAPVAEMREFGEERKRVWGAVGSCFRLAGCPRPVMTNLLMDQLSSLVASSVKRIGRGCPSRRSR